MFICMPRSAMRADGALMSGCAPVAVENPVGLWVPDFPTATAALTVRVSRQG